MHSVVLLCLLAASPGQGATKFKVAPAPAWFVLAPAPTDPAPKSIREGRIVRLRDTQFHLDEQHHLTVTERRVVEVTAADGIDGASNLEIDFNPEFQTLTLHRVCVRRRGACEDTLAAAKVKIIQKESELSSSRIFTGVLTAVYFIPDVRVGDTVETLYSIAGSNPVFEGKTDVSFGLDSPVPVELERKLVSVPSGAVFSLRTHGGAPPPVMAESAGRRTYEWKLEHVPAWEGEPLTPVWFDDAAWVELTEWKSWAEVVDWGVHLDAFAPSHGVQEEAEALSRGLSKEAALTATVRFVQDEIRYLAVEVGADSHRPQAPADTLRLRSGDCKSKALLLVALLRAQGVEAWPGLVHSERGPALSTVLPSPLSFNHEVVALQHEGKLLWIDATRSLIHGSALSQPPLPLFQGLLLRPGETGFTRIEAEPLREPEVEYAEHYTGTSWSSPVKLDIDTTFRGSEALSMRDGLSTQGEATLARHRQQRLALAEPGLEAQGSIEYEDSADSNVLVRHEHYLVRDFWKNDAHSFYADAVDQSIVEPGLRPRKAPFSTMHERWVRVRKEALFPLGFDWRAENRTVDFGGATLTFSSSAPAGQPLRMEWDYHTRVAEIPPEGLARWNAGVAASKKLLECGVVSGDSPQRQSVPQIDYRWLFAILAVAVTLLGLGALRSRLGSFRGWWRRRRFSAKLSAAAGESPQAPIRVDGLEQALARFASRRCECGKSVSAGAPGVVRLGGEELAAVPYHCDGCGKRTHLYFAGELEAAP